METNLEMQRLSTCTADLSMSFLSRDLQLMIFRTTFP